MKDRNSSKDSNGGKQKDLSDETDRIATISAARLKRIEEIWKAMNAGVYRVDGQRIAEKMVSDAVRRLRERMR